MTTVVAFFATGATSFTGIAELGIIAGGGILLCASGAVIHLASASEVVDQSPLGKRFPQPVPMHTGIAAADEGAARGNGIGVIVTIVGVVGISRFSRSGWFDYNLQNLQPEGLESVTLEHKLLTDCDRSMWYAISMADSREKLLELKEKYAKLSTVSMTEDIASLLAGNDAVKRPIITRIYDALANLPERPKLIAVDSLEELGGLLGQAQKMATHWKDGATARGIWSNCRHVMRRLPSQECFAKLSQFQQQMAGDLLSRLHVIRSVSSPEPPQLSDLPESLVSRFVGHSGKHLLANLW